MFKKRHNKPQNRIETLIGAGTILEGNLSFSGGLRVDGEIKGDVVVIEGKSGTLVLSEHGRINGRVEVTHLVVNGMVDGPLCATEYMELQAKARVRGDVHYKTLEIQIGAVVEGKLHQENAGTDKVVAFKGSGSN
jgi:cytoskeletal protein CcmA (bactofilin family)